MTRTRESGCEHLGPQPERNARRLGGGWHGAAFVAVWLLLGLIWPLAAAASVEQGPQCYPTVQLEPLESCIGEYVDYTLNVTQDNAATNDICTVELTLALGFTHATGGGMPSGWALDINGCTLTWEASGGNCVAPGATHTFHFWAESRNAQDAPGAYSHDWRLTDSSGNHYEGAFTFIINECTVPVPPQAYPPGMDLQVVPAAATVVPGTDFTYIATLTNTGGEALSGVVVTAALVPGGFTYLGWHGDEEITQTGTNPPTFAIDTLQVATSKLISLDFAVASNPAAVDNPAVLMMTAHGFDASDDPIDAEPATVSSPVRTPGTGLEVYKLADAPAVWPGHKLVYDITVTNTGEQKLYNIRVTDLLPDGLEFLGSQLTSGVYFHSDNPPKFDIPELEAGMACTFAINCRASADTTQLTHPVVNRVRAHGFDEAGNQVEATLFALRLPLCVPHASLDVEKIASDPVVVPGEPVTYLVRVTNNGRAPLFEIRVVDDVPAPFTLLRAVHDADVVQLPGDPPRFSIAQLRIGESKLIGLVFATDPDYSLYGAEVVNRAIGRAVDAAGTEVEAEPARAALSVVPKGASFTLSKICPDPQVTAGGETTYLVTIRNTGDQALHGLVLTDLAPAGLTLVATQLGAGVIQTSANPPTFEIAELAVHAELTFALTFEVSIAPGGVADPVVNRIEGTGLDEAGRPVTAAAENTLPLVFPTSGLTLFKTAMQDGVVPGGTVTYLLTLVNSGEQDLINITLTDSLPPGLTYCASSLAPGMHLVSTDPLVLEIDLLPAGSMALASITACASANADDFDPPVTNAADAVGTNEAGETVRSPRAVAVLPLIEPATGLDVEKVATTNRVIPGRQVTYLVTVTNTGDQALHDVRVTDVVPAGLTLSRAETDNDVTRIGTNPPVFNIPSLGVHESSMLSLIFDVTNDQIAIADPVVNVARAQGYAPGNDLVTAAPDSSVLPRVLWRKAIDVEKVSVESPFEAGGIGHYIITVTNTSDAPLRNVQVSDILDSFDALLPALGYLDAEPPGTPFLPNGVRWQLGDLMPGASHTIILTVSVPIQLNNSEADNHAHASGVAPDGITLTDGDDCSTPCRAQDSSIQVDKLANEPHVLMGGQVSYHLVVTNDGGQPLHRVAVRDTVPEGLSFVGADFDDQRWRLVSTDPIVQLDMIRLFEPTQSEALTLFFNASRDYDDYNMYPGDSTVVNGASVTGQDGLMRWLEDSDAAELNLLSPRPAIQVHYAHTTGQIVPGERATYLVKLENIGDQVLSDVLLSIPDLAGQGLVYEASNFDAAHVAADPVPGFLRWRLLQPLAKNGSEQVRVTYRVTNNISLIPDPVTSTASVTALDEEDNPVGDSATEAMPLSPKRGTLTLDNSAAQGEIYPGETVTFILTVQAGMDLDLTGLVVSAQDLTAQGLTYFQMNYDTDVFALTGAFEWTALDTFPAGTQEEIRITYRAADDVSALPSTVTLLASASALDLYGRPLADEDDEVLPVLLHESHLSLEKVALASALVPGEALTYLITATNNGNQALRGLTIVDPLPEQLRTFASYFDSTRIEFDPDPTQPTWTLLDDLAPGEAVSLRLVVESDPDPSRYGDTIIDVATASAQDEADETVTVQATDILPVHTPDIAVDVTKIPNQNLAIPGGTLGYTLRVQNVGRIDLLETTLTEEIPGGLTYTNSYFDAAAVTLVGVSPQVVWQIGLLAPGRAIEVQVFFDVSADPADLTNPLVNAVTAAATGAGNQTAIDIATATLPVQAADPQLLIAKRATSGVARPGELLRYGIEITNTGNLPLSHVVITDPLAAGLTYESSIYDPDLVELTGLPPALAWELVGALDPGERRTIDLIAYVATDPDSLTDPVCNTAVATGLTPGGATITDETSECLPLQLAAPRVTIQKFTTAPVIRPGEEFLYTIQITNTGNRDIVKAYLREELPVGMGYVSSVYDPNVLSMGGSVASSSTDPIWTVAALPVGATETVTVRLRAEMDRRSLEDPVVNVATIEAWDVLGQHFSDSDFEETPVAAIEPALHLDKLATTGSLTPGGQVTYLLSLTNNGDEDLYTVSVADTLPAGLTVYSTDYDALHMTETRTTAPDGRAVVTWSTDEMKLAAIEQVRLTCAVTDNAALLGEAVVNLAYARGYNLLEQLITDSDGDRVLVASAGSAVDIAKSALRADVVPGDYVTYMLTVRNAGGSALHDARVVDRAPVGLTYDQSSFDNTRVAFAGAAGDSVVWTLATLPVGGFEEIRVTYLAASSLTGNASADTLVNVATVEAIDPSSQRVQDTDDERLPIHPRRSAIQLLKWSNATNGLATLGAEISYHIQVINTGEQDLAPVTVIDYMPAGLRYLETDQAPDSVVVGEDETRIYWTIDLFHAVENWEALVRARIDTTLVDGSTIENRAHAIGIDERGGEVRASDASSVLAGLPDVQIEKNADRPIARPGEKVSYTITYRNSGTADAQNVVVMDLLPEHVTYVTGSATGGAFYEPRSNSVTRTIDHLEIDRGAIFSYQVALDPDLALGSRIPNTATVYADAVSPAESDTAWVQVSDKAADLVKTVDRTVATVGDTLTYTLTYHNLSDEDYTWVQLIDPVPAELDYLPGSAEPAGTYHAGDRRVVWEIPQGVRAGEIGHVTFQGRVRPDAGAMGQVANEATLEAATVSDTTLVPSNRVVTLVVETVGVAIAKSVDRALAVPGDLLTYHVQVTNLGPAPLTAIDVSDAVPEELTYAPFPDDWTAESVDPAYDPLEHRLVWHIGVIGPYESVALQFRARVNDVASGTLVSNLATAETHETEPVVSSPAITLVQYPDLSITKTPNLASVVVGQQVEYTVRVRNQSDGPTDSTWVDDLLPEGFDYVTGSTVLQLNDVVISNADPRTGDSPGSLSWRLGRLGAYAQIKLQYRAVVTGAAGPGLHENRALACGVTPLHATLCTDPVIASVEVVVPEITITKTTGERAVEVGDIVLYRIALQSNSAAAVSGLAIRDHLPVGFEILPGSSVINGVHVNDPVTQAAGLAADDPRGPAGYEAERNVAIWPLGSLGAGEEIELTYVVVVGLNAASGIAINVAEAIGLDDGGGRVLAGPAEARVFVIDDALPSRLRGRVIIDCDGDGLPDQPQERTLRFSPGGTVVDEQGNAVAGLGDENAIQPYAGIDVLVEDGRRVQTDGNGEFFFYPLERGDHAVYLDPRGLEQGTQILSQDSQFFTVLEGGEARIEFRICPPPPRRGSVQLLKSVTPAEVVAIKRVLEPEVFLIEGILFDTGKTTLLPAADGVLAEAAQRLLEDPTATASIEGHTDIRPIHTAEFPDNYALSDGRAKVVRDALAEKFGIERARMTTKGYGPDRPVAPNTNARNLSLNRRTEIIVLPSLADLTPAALFDPSEITFHVTATYQGEFPPGEGAIRDAAVTDALPSGLEYLLNSTKMNGQVASDPEILLGALSASEGGQVSGERLLKWNLNTIWPGDVFEIEYRVLITDVPGGGATYRAGEGRSGTGTSAPEIAARVVEVDALLRDPAYREKSHLWENRAWFVGVTAEGKAIQTDAVGADLQLAFVREQKPIRIVVDDVLFDTGKAILRPEAFGVLDPAADLIRSRPNCQVKVEGHTDIRPIQTREFPSNQELSEARARAIVDYFVNIERLDAKIFSTRGFGPRRPLADNDTEAGRQKNRRVEILISADDLREVSIEPTPGGTRPDRVVLELR